MKTYYYKQIFRGNKVKYGCTKLKTSEYAGLAINEAFYKVIEDNKSSIKSKWIIDKLIKHRLLRESDHILKLITKDEYLIGNIS